MTYFKNIRSIAGLKKQYRKLALQLHPDTNTLNLSEAERKLRTEKFQEMEAEYKKLYQKLTEPQQNPQNQQKNQKPPKSAKNAEKTSPTNAPQSTKTEQAEPNHGLKNRIKTGIKNFAKSDVGSIVLDETETAIHNIVSRTLKTFRNKITE